MSGVIFVIFLGYFVGFYSLLVNGNGICIDVFNFMILDVEGLVVVIDIIILVSCVNDGEV